MESDQVHGYFEEVESDQVQGHFAEVDWHKCVWCLFYPVGVQQDKDDLKGRHGNIWFR